MCQVCLSQRLQGGSLTRDRLIKYTVECVRTRLDRVYLETLVGASGTTNHRRGHVAEVMALKDELESLYSEILPVAQMSVEQRYLESALKFINAQDLNGDQKSSKAIDYVHMSDF
jgi:hypothetical protein